jgi:hypothetical protein
MANQIHNTNMTLDEILREEPEPTTVTPLKGGNPTEVEAEAAFDELFKDIWRKNR